MNKRIFTFMLLFAAAVFAVAALRTSDDKEKEFTQSHKVQNFTTIENNTPADIYYIQANRPVVEVVGPEKLVKNIKISCNGGKLTITTRQNIRYSGKINLRIRVASPSLTHYTGRGSGDFNAKKPLNLKTITIENYGSGDTEISQLKCSNLTTITRGSGDIQIKSVQAGNQVRMETYGSGDIDMSAQCGALACITRGSGDIELKRMTVKGNSTLESFGSGDIHFKGKSGNLDLTLRGSGDGNLEVECQALKIRTYGSGDVVVSGNAHTFEKEKRGSGDIYSHGLRRK